jgi:tetratricopeptide (TPR) repeat protein
MANERWQEVRLLFFELAELGPEERAVRLESLSEIDPELHAELRRLLAAHDETDELLDSFENLMSQPGFEPSPTPDQRATSPDPHGLIGRTVSHYEVAEVLGAGGMGVLYKALDTRLGRTVALKFLPPQWSLDTAFKARFEREARAVAALDHPNVCTVHEIGETEDGQLFIAMAFYQGETVKEKIARGPLEVPKALELATQAASGLTSAHRAGLVHRDIKPANLMVTDEGVLKILDFGLAKTGETALTESGMRLGTPAYMSPEQTRGTDVDARTDLWSLGVVLYEMLTGQRPFRGGQDSAVIDAIRRENPQPPSELRTDLPNDVSRLVLGLLSKDPDARYAGAEQLLDELAGAYRRTAGTKRSVQAVRRSTPWLVLGGYAVFGWLAIQIAEPLRSRFALPPWLGQAFLIALALGFAVLLFTALIQTAGRVRKSAAGPTAGVARLFTLRNAGLGGVIVLLLLAATMAGYAAMRAFGIGPPATLIAQGRFERRGEVIVAEFANETRDPLLGPALTRALRIDLGQSPVVRVVDPDRVAGALERMEVAPHAKLDLALAREVAFRERISAVVAGAVDRIGSGYVLSAELFTADGEPLLSARETAADSTEILAALARLSKGLRERIGEPLRSIGSRPYILLATTSNLEALKKFVAAGKVWTTQDPDSLKLLEEAIALDSTFALAWWVLGGTLLSMGERARAMDAVTRAFELRDQANERERYLIMGFYFDVVTGEREKAAQAYRDLLALDPDDNSLSSIGALNLLTNQYMELRQFARAEVTSREMLRKDSLRTGAQPGYDVGRLNLAKAQVNLGKYDEARATLLAPVASPDSAEAGLPAFVNWHLASVASAAGDYATAEQHFGTLGERMADNPVWRIRAASGRAALSALQGHLNEARELKQEDLAFFEQRGLRARHVQTVIELARLSLLVQGDTASALALIETELARYPLSEMSIADRPYDRLIIFFSLAGAADRARALLAEYEREAEPKRETQQFQRLLGEIAFADGDYQTAASHFEQADSGLCLLCALPGLARTYDQAGEADAALATFERYVTTPFFDRLLSMDQYVLGPSYERLGQLYDERGDQENAARNYAQFVELWREADSELQPRVQAAQKRLEEIVARRG